MKPSPAPSDSGAAHTTRIVLLVDDEMDILLSLRRFIERSIPNTLVLTAESGADALKILAKERVEAIVSDYKMPNMDGLAFLQEARRRAPGIPRILVTAFPDLDVATRAINEARIHNFFIKPFDVVAVIEGIKEALHGGVDEGRNGTPVERDIPASKRAPHTRA